VNIENLSITELKQMLARVNHDLKLNKPTIKRIKKEQKPELSEAAICNEYALKYSGNKALPTVHNARLIQDIAIQRDILNYLQNGGTIITRKTRKKIKPLSIKPAVISL
jgi:hypothetical protein